MKTTKRRHKLIKTYLILKFRLDTIYKCIIYKEYRVYYIKRVTDKNMYKEKIIKLMFYVLLKIISILHKANKPLIW